MAIDYAVENRLDVTEMVDIFRRSGLAERRPVDDKALMTAMAAGVSPSATSGSRLPGWKNASSSPPRWCFV